ncbi:hypothetical protein BDZ45DRAFT_805184 [Acephala macrosclerotiorum]|nr:hypothetical protein BDZ45DRAFT_805184 [Acephala macrosclerotiorum]
MAGRTTTLHRTADSSDDEYQEHQPRRKTTRRVATPARPRTVRHRQVKLIPSVETYTPALEIEPEPIVSDSESDFIDLDTLVNGEKAAAAKRPILNRPGRETVTAGSSRVSPGKRAGARNGTDEPSTEEASEFNPSEADDGSSETDGTDRPRKRSRIYGAQSSSRTKPSSTAGRQNKRHDRGEGSSRDVRVLLPSAPIPNRPAEPTRGSMNSGGWGRLKGVRIEPGPSQIPTNRLNRSGRVAERHDPGEGSSRAVPRREADSVQYLHTLPRSTLRAAPLPEIGTLVDRTKKGVETQPSSSRQLENTSSAPSRNQIHDPSQAFSREFRTVVVKFQASNSQVELQDRDFVFNLVDCRNERNGLDGLSSKGKQKAVHPSQKCQPCFKFRRNCDQAAGSSCGACTRTKSKCIPRRTQATRYGVEELPAQEFSGSKLWEKCRSCAALDKQCTFNEDEDNCKNCKTRGWKCQPQMAPKPRKRKEYQGRFQDVKLKCHYCVKSRAHCDGAKPKCGHCVKWAYRCYPPGTELPKKVPKDEKCKRCRQLKLACHEKLPCPRCIEQGIECGMTAKEERLQAAFLGD